MQHPVYLDNNATTRLAPSVLDAMRSALDTFGNPSSRHAVGRGARSIVESARSSVAQLIGARSSEIAFTSGGTESDNWAILGSLRIDPSRTHIVTTRVEHEAVRKTVEELERQGMPVTWMDVDHLGRLDLDQLRDSLSDQTAIVSVMMANNETGVIFPIKEVAEIVRSRSNAVFHVDAVNAVGKIAVDVRELDVDLLSLSAHKFHGPKGTGALYIRDGIEFPSIYLGGGQESGRRAGTEAVHQIAGMGAAAKFVSDLSAMNDVARHRDRLESGILKRFGVASVNGDPTDRLPNTSNISFENLNGEMILHYLDEAGIFVSTGSACNSESRTSSPVLAAMNLPYSQAMGSVRFSLSRMTTDVDIDQAISVLEVVIEKLRAMSSA